MKKENYQVAELKDFEKELEKLEIYHEFLEEHNHEPN